MSGRNVVGKRGALGSRTLDPIICSTYIGKTCFTGNVKGVILAWGGGSAGKDVTAHLK